MPYFRFLERNKNGDMRIKHLKKMVQAEVAADSWWDSMSDNEKKAYLKAHPGSKYGGSGGVNGVTSNHMLNESKMRMLQRHHESQARRHAGSTKGAAHKAAAALYAGARRSYNKAAISKINGERDLGARHAAEARRHKAAADDHSRKHGIYATVERK